MEESYVLFDHKEEKYGAFLHMLNPKSISFTFQGDFFAGGDLWSIPLDEVETESKKRGYQVHDTRVTIRDDNLYHTYIEYDNGYLVRAETKTDKLVTINPQKAFNFWVSFSEALRNHEQVPEQMRKNLERIAHITSLKEYFEGLREKHGSLDKYFGMDYVHRILRRGEIYHPVSLDNNPKKKKK